MTAALAPHAGVAAGVPYVAVPPVTPSSSAPVVVAWHLLDPPRRKLPSLPPCRWPAWTPGESTSGCR